jgi:hypothetical protein
MMINGNAFLMQQEYQLRMLLVVEPKERNASGEGNIVLIGNNLQ